MLTLQQIKDSLNDLEIELSTPTLLIKYLSIDTRSIIMPGSTLFFALSGSRKDGHSYIPEAYENGCRSFVVNMDFDQSPYPNAHFIPSDNIVRTLQRIAFAHRKSFNLPMIGITGSNGKTWVKEWLFESLQATFNIVRSPGSYNSQIGVALSVWNISEGHDLGIIEAGISTQNEMQRIEQLILPTIGIFTGLGDAHQEGFDDLENKLKEKIKLFKNCNSLIYHLDTPIVTSTIKNTYPNKEHLTVSRKDKNASLFIQSTTSIVGGTQVTYRFNHVNGEYMIPFDDNISIQNSFLVALTNLFLGSNQQNLNDVMAQLSPMDMRLQIVDAIQGSTLINDAYSLDLNSLKWALKKLEVVGQKGEKMIILSDILQHDKDAYTQIADLLQAHKITHLIGIGNQIQTLKSILPSEIQQQYFVDSDELIKTLPSTLFNNKTILLKGARPFQFEKIADALTEKSHTVSLHIDFDAMLHNLQYFGRHIPNGTKLMGVIKASAYGSGSVEIARFLSFFKLDYVAVAVIDEGITLRKEGIKLPILVLNPNANSFDELFSWDLEPEVYSFNVLEQCIQSAKSLSRSVPIHIKLNSGMNRLGFDPRTIQSLSETLQNNANRIEVASIFSHLSSSDEHEKDGFTIKQVESFQQMYDFLCQQLGKKPWRHILNSSGILRFPQYSYEMVRLGIGLYGVGMGNHNEFLKPVHSMRARVIQLRTIEKGDVVGYGNSFTADQTMTIATVNVGYADGLPRLAGNGKYACLIQNQKAPIVGRVCMDMIMCDVSKVIGVFEGADVWVFNQKQSLEELSRSSQTIPYEILSQIAPRVKRVFQYV